MRVKRPRSGLYSTIRSIWTVWEKSNRNYNRDNVNFTKICPYFGFADATQFWYTEVLKIRDFSKLLRMLFATPRNSSATHQLGTTALECNKWFNGIHLHLFCAASQRLLFWSILHQWQHHKSSFSLYSSTSIQLNRPGHKYSFFFGVSQPGSEPNLPAEVACAQFKFFFKKKKKLKKKN